MIPHEYIEELTRRTDIVELVGSYVQLKRKGRLYGGLCPFHSEKSPSFYVYPDTQSFYCFGCGAGGDAITFAKKINSIDYPEAVKMLAARAGMPEPQEDDKTGRMRSRILSMNKEAARFFHACLNSTVEEARQARAYWRRRGLDDKTINRFGLGYAPDDGQALYQYLRDKGYNQQELDASGLFKRSQSGRIYCLFWRRVMTPIFDLRGNIIAFGGRVLDDSKPKYVNSPETLVYHKSDTVFALQIAKRSASHRYVLCEGYMDVISMHQAGFSNAVASLGTALTEKHATLLKRYTDEVILTYDSDDAGVRAALRAIPIVKRAGLRARVLHMNPYKDPDEFIKTLGAEKFQERIDQAENSFMFEISVLERNYDMKDPEGKTSFFQAVSEKLMEFEQELERENYIQAVAEKYHIGFDNLRKMVNRSAMRAIGREVPKSAVNRERKEIRKKSQDDGMKQSQRLMLTWLIDKKGLYAKVKPYLDADDFTEDLYHQAAQLLFEQLEKSELNPARIINHFEDPETQKEVASLFHAKLNLQSQAEFDKALNETLRKIINNSIEFRTKNMNPADIAGLQKILLDRKKVQDMPKITYQM